MLFAVAAVLVDQVFLHAARPRLAVLVPLVLMGMLGAALRERDLGPHLGVSVTTVVLAAALPLTGPTGAVIVGGVVYATDMHQRRVRTRTFNAAMTAAMGGGGGIVYALAGGEPVGSASAGAPQLLLELGLPLVLAYVCMAMLNAGAIGLMSSIVRGSHWFTVAVQALRSLGLAYLSHVVIAFLFVVLWGPAELGALSTLFVLGPLLAAHWSISREAVARREHQETVTSFVAALEQADPGSVGHSARVADLAERMAPHLGIGGVDAEVLRYAALLHDIGLVTVRGEVPPDQPVDEAEYLTSISAHPQAGVSVLAGLDFLSGALPAIAHHHERWDGLGYPVGLRGEEIPLAARVIAVADAFDALTNDRGGDSMDPLAAVDELRRRAGTHLDPRVVEALREALPRVPGPLGRRSRLAPGPPVSSAHGPVLTPPDHDHPSVSDAFASWQPESVGRTP